MPKAMGLRRAAVLLLFAVSLPILAAGAAALPARDGQPLPRDPELVAQQEAIEAQREALFRGTPAIPEAISDLSRAKLDMPTTEVHARLHDASAQALEEADLSLLLEDPRLELLLIPRTWVFTDDALSLIGSFGGVLEVTAFHVAFPGQERTSVGIIERIDESDWASTLESWHEFFTRSMEDNRIAALDRLDEEGESADDEMAPHRRHLDDIEWMLESSRDGRYPVYALRVVAGAHPEDDEWAAVVQRLRSEGFGGFLIPKGKVPAALMPPEDPSRDAYIRENAPIRPLPGG